MPQPESPPDRLLFLSVKPIYAEAILSGAKTIELRRSRPRITVPTEALIYASSPTMALVGECVVEDITEWQMANLWKSLGPQTGVDRFMFDTYFEGAEHAVALHLTKVRRLTNAVSLEDIRDRVEGFEPPQSFRYVSRAKSEALTA